jgi:hypothetical protein
MLNSAIKSEAEALHRFFSPDRTKATVVNQVISSSLSLVTQKLLALFKFNLSDL